MRTKLTHPSGTQRQAGFSLAEMSVALAIVSLLFLAALSLMALDQRIYAKQDQTLEAVREGRHALETMERDLLMLGYLVDTQTVADIGPDGTSGTDDDIIGQPQIVYAAAYDFAFNAEINNATEAIADGSANDTVPIGYAPVSFFTGAETIRYTLDSTGDGSISSADRGDESEEAVNPNTGLYALQREVYGSNASGNFKDKGAIALMRGPVAYPSGAKPVPLFQYWGDFDSDAALDLWGDDGAGGGTAGNGILELGEINALTAVSDEDNDNDNTIDSGEDRNGDGVLQRRIADLIKRVEVHVTTETSVAEMDYYDPVRSSISNKFKYRVATANTDIRPRNIDLPGGSCRDNPEPIPSISVANACPDPLADGIVEVGWGLSPDDGGGEYDIAKYMIYRTDRDNVFGQTPYDEVNDGDSSWQDNQINVRTWPPVQYWYKTRAMDCTPALSELDPVAGAYPALVGAHYPAEIRVVDVPGDAGDALEIQFDRSPDEPSNTTGYGGNVDAYHVYRSTSEDYRCVAPINSAAITANGSATYIYADDATNSTSAPAYGSLHFYWMRSLDDNSALSPYSPRYCGRPYVGPTFPVKQGIRVANYGSSDHPVEIYFTNNQRNADAGYDQESIDYKIYRSRDLDSDGSLDSLVDESAGYRPGDLVASVKYEGIVYAVGDGGLNDVQMSLDRTNTFRALGDLTLEVINGVSFGSRLSGVVVGSNGVTFATDTGGASWVDTSPGITEQLNDVAHVDAEIVVAVGQTGTILLSDDGGKNWSNILSGVGDDLNSVSATGDLVFVTGDSGAALISTDRGRNFTQVAFTTDSLAGGCAVTEGTGDITLYAGGQDRIFRSLDGGTTWNEITMGADKMKVACQPGGRVVVTSEQGDKIYTATDGVTFTTAAVSTYHPLDAAFLDDNFAYAVDSSGMIHSWSLNSNLWYTNAVDGLMTLRSIAVRPETAWEDSSTATAITGTPYYYVVTASYAEGDPTLDGECGLLPDRPSTVEIPDDGDAQVLVDACNNFELAVTVP
jgi:prepilin-type N-terminal cleavage/methylation domain-containing protein